ncbi:MAG: hypothetical protein V7785_10415 [Bermanella sp.]
MRTKIIVILLSLILLSLGVYRYIAVDIHVEEQVKVICNWLNSSSDGDSPKVGPLAHKKLKYLKVKYSNNFKCEIEEPPINMIKYYEKAIVIYHNGINKLGLLYEFGGGVKQAFKPHYTLLWTPKDSGENEYENF